MEQRLAAVPLGVVFLGLAIYFAVHAIRQRPVIEKVK